MYYKEYVSLVRSLKKWLAVKVCLGNKTYKVYSLLLLLLYNQGTF